MRGRSKGEGSSAIAFGRVSKAHALIVQTGHGIYIRDLASRNHVYVNRQRIEEVTLAELDTIRIGPFTLSCGGNFSATDSLDEIDAPPAQLRAQPDDDSHEVQSLPITGRTVVIGSREGCDMIIEESAVNSSHAVVFERDGRRFIRDLDTSAGTFVNDAKIRQVELNPGDVIGIGTMCIEYLTDSQELTDETPEQETSDHDPAMAERLLGSKDEQWDEPTRPRPTARTDGNGTGRANGREENRQRPWRFNEEDSASISLEAEH